MKLHKLQSSPFVSIADGASGELLPRKAMEHVPLYRRDHGNPFGAVVPQQSSTSIAPASTPTPAAASTIVAAPPASEDPIALPTVTSTITTSSQLKSSTTATTSSTVIPTSTTSPASLSFSSRASPTNSLTPIAVAPVQTSPVEAPSQSSSNSDRTWVIIGIFALSFLLVGLVVFIIMSSRRRARRKRAKAPKREVELTDVGDVERAAATGPIGTSTDVWKAESGVVQDLERMRMERKRELEGMAGGHGKEDDEWEQELPAYAL